MTIKVNEEKLKNGLLEFETKFTIINQKKSFAFVSIPFKSIKVLSWNKETKLKIIIEELKE